MAITEIGGKPEPRRPVRVGARTRLERLRRDGAAHAILAAVAKSRRLGRKSILGAGRAAGTTFARQLAMYLIHVELGRPQDAVALMFGRERTTVSYACAAMERVRDDPKIEAEIAAIIAGATARRETPSAAPEMVLHHAA